MLDLKALEEAAPKVGLDASGSDKPDVKREPLVARYKHNPARGAVSEANAYMDALFGGASDVRPNGSPEKIRDSAGLVGQSNPDSRTVTNDYAGFRKWLELNGYKSKTFTDTEWYRLNRYRVQELSAAWLAAATLSFYNMTKYAKSGATIRL